MARWRRFLAAAAVAVAAALVAVNGQQNAREEAICAPFLTSPRTAPILAHLERNLTVDEAAEFACELVLQDQFLPSQIRLTIHEGLHHLAVRHTQMGHHRARTASRHAAVMAQILPRSAEFHLRAGTWAFHPDVGDINAAVHHFSEVLYGNASSAQANGHVRYKAAKGLIKALAQADKPLDALLESIALLEAFPFDLEAVFQVKSGAHRLSPQDQRRASTATRRADALVGIIEQLSTNDYKGLSSDGGNWQVTRLDRLVTPEELLEHIRRREPFVMSLGDVEALSVSLGWNVARWVNEQSYLERRVAERAGEDLDGESLVLVELPSASMQACASATDDLACYTFGNGLSVRRVSKPFGDMMRGALGSDVYLNVQLPNSGRGGYNPPLHLLADDVPLSKHALFDAIRSNVTDVTLWLGLQGAVSEASSRLHRDALDNLYFSLEGRKRFVVWDPSKVKAMKTLSPTVAVSPQGLAYQLDVNKLRALLLQVQPDLPVLLQSTASDSSETHVLREFLASEDIAYEVDGLHFSSLLSVLSPDLPPPSAEVNLRPGDIFYLPTGWFHRVTSFADQKTPFNRPGGARLHLALNVWWRALDWERALDVEVQALVQLTERFIASALPPLPDSGDNQGAAPPHSTEL